uniref:NADH-ubiquinone oxidoreductase chain 4 n=1 Tax=Japananus hyalinus TaxID=1256066 RepID=A0A343BSW4_9HEMI|nr:NADH dehydrogenase subunit 4 [Japananus hyalinus]ARA90985.1 NADH dehydrogenase subunit 4 [Japananus hyalinus]
MMSLIMYMLFMIPLVFMSNWILNQVSILFLLFYVLSLSFNNYFSVISYFMGLDSFSYSLITLSLLISSLMIISMSYMKNFCSFFFINFLLLMFLVLIFVCMNIMYMYISFEFVLIPLVMLIMGWGYQPERLMAGMYLFFYTIFVSLPLLMLIMYMYMSCGSMFFDYLKFESTFFLIHLILVIVFLVKLPMYFFHFWLPKAHVQAPVSGSMILAGLMLKIGGYGLIRVIYIYENLFIKYSYIWFSLSMVGSLLSAILCLVQGDMKCLIAYSSISHMGMVIMGISTLKIFGLLGSFLMMISHGFCSSGLFYIANLFYIRTSSRSFYINKGLMTYIPSGSMLLFLMCSFNMSCPPSINFISELMILISLLNFWFKSFIYFSFISFFCACFSYYLYSFSQHGISHSLYSCSSMSLLEFLCLYMHIIPLTGIPLMLLSLF